jgi:hypothetical protein
MKNPTIEQVDFVIDKLKSVRDDAIKKGAFDMNVWRVYSKKNKHECGTIHCVAGWYAVANLHRKEIKAGIKEGLVRREDGANLMANDLGFEYGYVLAIWAEDNPKIWGNEDGDEMFESELSYDDEGFDGVISQWELVRDNLIELKKENSK